MLLFFVSPLRSSHPFTAPRRDAVRVRIRAVAVWELAHKRQGTRIFAVGEIPVLKVRVTPSLAHQRQAWVYCSPRATAIAVVLRTCFAYREALAEQSALAHSCEHGLASLDYLPHAKFP